MTAEEKRLKKNAYMREWNKKNYSRLKTEGKLYKQRNPEKYKEIHKKAAKKWVKNNPEKSREINKRARKNNHERVKLGTKKWRENNPTNVIESNKRGNLKRYGITLEYYNKMFDEQNGCCKICAVHQVELKRSLYVDHCHTTGKVRGLLCHKCNTSLGGFDDNILLLQKAINYLSM